MPIRQQPTDPLSNSALEASNLIRERKRAQTEASAEDKGPEPIYPEDMAHRARRAKWDKKTQGIKQFFNRIDFSQPKTRNFIYIASSVIVICIVAVLIMAIAPFTSGEMSDEMAEQRYVSPYDWGKLSRGENGRFAYVVDGETRSRVGIDVSENQHQIDWNAVAADGIEFAFIRLGYRGATAGDLYLDKYFYENLQGAQDAGIDCGIYFFSQAQTPEEAVEEADFVLQYLGNTNLEYPIVFDSEERVAGVANSRTSGLDTAQMTAIAEAFCNRIEAAGYNTMVYGNAHDISRYHRSNMEERALWWAEYGVPHPTARIDFVLWQYSNVGRVDGIIGDVDMNIDLSHVLD